MGQKIVLAGPSAARDLGIGMVFQHFDLQMGDFDLILRVNRSGTYLNGKG